MKQWMADIFTGLLVGHRMEIIGCAFWHDDSEGERLDRSSHKRLLQFKNWSSLQEIARGGGRAPEGSS